jgi:hypothetical protein
MIIVVAVTDTSMVVVHDFRFNSSARYDQYATMSKNLLSRARGKGKFSAADVLTF